MNLVLNIPLNVITEIMVDILGMIPNTLYHNVHISNA